MKLLILSDLHLEFGVFNVPKIDYDVVILAGDIFVPGSKAMRWARRADTFGDTVSIVFVPGNHEFYSGVLQTTQKEMALSAAACKVHLLAPGEAVIEGVRFLGCTLWTDFELPIQAKAGPIVDIERAMKIAKLKLNDYSSIRWAKTPEPADQSMAHVKPRKRRLTPSCPMCSCDRACTMRLGSAMSCSMTQLSWYNSALVAMGEIFDLLDSHAGNFASAGVLKPRACQSLVRTSQQTWRVRRRLPTAATRRYGCSDVRRAGYSRPVSTAPSMLEFSFLHGSKNYGVESRNAHELWRVSI